MSLEIIVEEVGQALLGLLSGSAVIYMFMQLLNMVTAF